jgi:hypothetical protein
MEPSAPGWIEHFAPLIVAGVVGMGGLVVETVRRLFARVRRLEHCRVHKDEFEELDKVAVRIAEFDALDKEAVRKEEFRAYVHRTEQSTREHRQEVRAELGALYRKLDELQVVLLREFRR